MFVVKAGFLSLIGTLVFVAVTTDASDRICTTAELRQNHPILCHMLDRLAEDEEQLANDIHEWAAEQGLLVDTQITMNDMSSVQSVVPPHLLEDQLPVVFAHGMGDSCFNSGMQKIANYTSDLLGGVFVTCVPTGDTRTQDTNNGYFLNMDASVDVFAAKIIAEPQLANGFHAIGFSQGNNVIRGYIANYNNPPVQAFLSVNGVNAGVGAVPYCRPKQERIPGSAAVDNHDVDGAPLETDLRWSTMCDLLMEQASRRAYTEWAQQHSFQANYWRDPRPQEREKYEEFSQLARWNNEGHFNKTLKDNYAKTKKFIWVLATEDGMVWPKEGEQWGAPDPDDPFNTILDMHDTEWYINDLFGLKTAEMAGKNKFESFVGDHLQFQMEDFDRWVTTYLAVSDDSGNDTTSIA